MPLIQVNDQAIFYAARAPEQRPVLLLIHGAGGSHLDWPAQLRRFAPLGSIAVDLPGHGRSSPPARSAISAYADDLLELLRKLDLTQTVLVGHSMGGAVALDIASRQNSNVVGVVLIATGARLRVSRELLSLVESRHDLAVEHITAAAWGASAPPELVDRASQLMRTCQPATLKMDFLACNDFDVMSQLGSVNVPTLVICGSADRMTPPKFSRYLADQIPDAELVTIAEAGHMLAMEQPDLVGNAVREFVERRLLDY